MTDVFVDNNLAIREAYEQYCTGQKTFEDLSKLLLGNITMWGNRAYNNVVTRFNILRALDEAGIDPAGGQHPLFRYLRMPISPSELKAKYIFQQIITMYGYNHLVDLGVLTKEEIDVFNAEIMLFERGNRGSVFVAFGIEFFIVNNEGKTSPATERIAEEFNKIFDRSKWNENEYLDDVLEYYSNSTDLWTTLEEITKGLIKFKSMAPIIDSVDQDALTAYRCYLLWKLGYVKNPDVAFSNFLV